MDIQPIFVIKNITFYSIIRQVYTNPFLSGKSITEAILKENCEQKSLEEKDC
jgi:hypothetical protein